MHDSKRIAPGCRQRKAGARLTHTSLAALAALISAHAVMTGAAGAADVEITADTGAVDLDALAGTTARVASGVTVSGGVSATLQAWDVTNEGGIAGGNAVVLHQGGAVVNAAGASIDSTLSGIVMGLSGPGGGAGSVDNFGTIVGGIGEGVTLFDGGTVINRAGASVSTSTGLNAVSVGQGTSRAVINSGTISSTRLTGFSTGVLMQGGPASLTNTATGTIFGDFNGVYTSGSAPLTLDNAGTITGRRGPAIEADGGGTFVNSGTIESESDGILTRGNGPSTVTNSGTIGSTGSGRAIAFGGNGLHTLNLDTGSVLNGNVQGGSGIDNLVLLGTGSEAIAKFLGFETLSMQGAQWTLTGTGTFSTGTTLAGGVLQVDGRLTSPNVEVEAAGTLGGLGEIVGNVTVGGRLAPGAAALGTLTVTGNAAFDPGSVFGVRIAADGGNDLLAVTGTATLAGTVEVTTVDAQANYLDGQTYTILTATDPLTTAFGGVAMAAPSAFITPSLVHNANDVVLTLAVTRDFTTAARTFNQHQAATGLFDLDQTAGSDALAAFNAIAMMDAGDARRAFGLSSGEIHAAAQHAIDHTASLFNRTLRQQGLAGVGAGTVGAEAFAAPLADRSDPGSGVRGAWVAPLGGWGSVDGDGNAAALDWWTAGVAGGYEAALDVGSGSAVAGFGLGYLRSHGAVDDRLSSFDSNGFHIGAYGARADGPWAVAGALSYGANRVSTDRNIAFLGRVAEAEYWRHTLGLSGEASYGLDLSAATRIAPLATLDAGWSGHDGFTETGAGALNLTSGAQSWTRFDTGIGLALTHAVATDGGQATFEARAVWEHAFADVVPSHALSLAGSPTGFTVRGPDAGRDRLRVGAGLAWAASADMTIRARYDGLLSGDQASHTASLGLLFTF